MANHKCKLELTWIGMENRPRLDPRILLEDPGQSYHAARSKNPAHASMMETEKCDGCAWH